MIMLEGLWLRSDGADNIKLDSVNQILGSRDFQLSCIGSVEEMLTFSIDLFHEL